MASRVLQNALWGPALPGAIFGLTLTWVSTTTITVQPGFATDSTNQRTMKLTTALTKSTAAWAAGNAGGLDTGTIAPNTGYHWYEIFNLTTGAVDIVYSATATPLAGPTLMPSGFTMFRLIGWSRTNASSQWRVFLQLGDNFIWDVPNQDIADSSTVLTSRVGTLLVPLGRKITPIFNIIYTAANGVVRVSSMDASDLTAANSNGTGKWPASAGILMSGLEIITNVSGQVRYQCDTVGSVFQLSTFGWIDTRGRLS